MQVTDRPSPDAPSLTQAIIVQMVYLDRSMLFVRRFQRQVCLFIVGWWTTNCTSFLVKAKHMTPKFPWKARTSWCKPKRSLFCISCHQPADRRHSRVCSWKSNITRKALCMCMNAKPNVFIRAMKKEYLSKRGTWSTKRNSLKDIVKLRAYLLKSQLSGVAGYKFNDKLHSAADDSTSNRKFNKQMIKKES